MAHPKNLSKSFPIICVGIILGVIISAQLPIFVNGNSDPHQGYGMMPGYNDVLDFFEDEGNLGICDILAKPENTDLIKEWVTQHPDFERIFQDYEKIGQVPIFVTRNSVESRTANKKVMDHPNCNAGFRAWAGAVRMRGHKFFLGNETKKFPFLKQNYHVILCPPFLALRGVSENGILCSRYPLNIEEGMSIVTHLREPEPKEVECYPRTFVRDENLRCSIVYNQENFKICRDTYSADYHGFDEPCRKSGAERCRPGFTICGLIVANFETALAHSFNLCCSNLTETNYPLSVRKDKSGDINVEVIKRFIQNLRVCDTDE